MPAATTSAIQFAWLSLRERAERFPFEAAPRNKVGEPSGYRWKCEGVAIGRKEIPIFLSRRSAISTIPFEFIFSRETGGNGL